MLGTRHAAQVRSGARGSEWESFAARRGDSPVVKKVQELASARVRAAGDEVQILPRYAVQGPAGPRAAAIDARLERRAFFRWLQAEVRRCPAVPGGQARRE